MKMKTKAVAILLLAMFALSSIAVMMPMPVSAAGPVTLSDAEMMLTEFDYLWGPATSVVKTDVDGPGVQFDFEDLADNAGTGVGDDFAVNSLAGGSGQFNGDFTAYDEYSVVFRNVGTTEVMVCVDMNTGWTNEPYAQGQGWARNTYWQSFWTDWFGPGETRAVTLDFSSSGEAWNIADDVEYPGHTDGEHGTAMWRLDEVSQIGFQVLGRSDASIIVSEYTGTWTELYLDPDKVTKGPGDVCTTFTMDVVIENYAGFMGFDIRLTWEHTAFRPLLNLDDVEYTSYLDTLWTDWMVAKEEQGDGYYRLAALRTLPPGASGAGPSILFRLTFHVKEGCNFPRETVIHFDLVKLSDDTVPIPEPIPVRVTDGIYYWTGTIPDLEFKVKINGEYAGDPPYYVEYCDQIEVEVWVTDICCEFMDYHLWITYDPALVAFLGVDYWGPWEGTFSDTGPGTIMVEATGEPWCETQRDALLFALTFHVEYVDDCTPDHFWKICDTTEEFQVEIIDAELSFTEDRIIPMAGIIIDPPLDFTVNLIRGDVHIDGQVTMADISDAAYYYDTKEGDAEWNIAVKYDLNCDGIIDVFDLVAIATNYGYGT